MFILLAATLLVGLTLQMKTAQALCRYLHFAGTDQLLPNKVEKGGQICLNKGC